MLIAVSMIILVLEQVRYNTNGMTSFRGRNCRTGLADRGTIPAPFQQAHEAIIIAAGPICASSK